MRVRQHWELGDQPIANMVSLLERNGIILSLSLPLIVEKSMLLSILRRKQSVVVLCDPWH